MSEEMKQALSLSAQVQEASERVALKSQVNASLTNSLTMLESLSAHVELKLDKSRADIAEMSLSREKLLLCQAKVARAEEELAQSNENVKFLSSFVSMLRRQIMALARLEQRGLYDSASDILRSMESHCLEIEAEWGKPIRELGVEHIAYEKAKLALLRCRHNAEIGLPYCGEAEADALFEDIGDLPTAYHSAREKEALLDEAARYKLFLLNARESSYAHDPDTLGAVIAERGQLLTALPNLSAQTALVEMALSKTIIDEYNELAALYFDEEPNIDKALAVFALRDDIDNALIAHPSYRDAKDVKEFRDDFLCQNALRKDASSYKDQVVILSAKSSDGDAESLELLARFISLPLIDSTKFDITLKSLKPLSFDKKVSFLASAISFGLDEEKQRLVFAVLERTRLRTRKGDLERMAKDLCYLDFHVGSTIKEGWKEMKEDLLRSPKAHKALVKTDVPELRIFNGENPSALKSPLGKKMRSAYVKSWGLLRYVLFWLFMIPIPAVLAAVAYALMYLNSVSEYIGTAIYALPFGIVIFLAMLSGFLFFGRDEKGSMALCRGFGLLGVLLLLCSAVFFALPEDSLAGASIVRLPLLILGIWTYGLSLCFYKERSRIWTYLILALFIIALGVAIGFMAYSMMNAASVN